MYNKHIEHNLLNILSVVWFCFYCAGELHTLFFNYIVSSKALHGYTAAESGVAAKTADEEQVAYWGTKVWGGP